MLRSGKSFLFIVYTWEKNTVHYLQEFNTEFLTITLHPIVCVFLSRDSLTLDQITSSESVSKLNKQLIKATAIPPIPPLALMSTI